MRDELVATQVPVDPGIRTTPLRTAQRNAVDLTSRVQIIDWHGQMKPWDRGITIRHVGILSDTVAVPEQGAPRKVQTW
jgi:hypothetical protein